MSVKKGWIVALSIGLYGCASVESDRGSTAEMRVGRQQTNLEARFQRYGPFTLLVPVSQAF